jgi:hypothetical protein
VQLPFQRPKNEATTFAQDWRFIGGFARGSANQEYPEEKGDWKGDTVMSDIKGSIPFWLLGLDKNSHLENCKAYLPDNSKDLQGLSEEKPKRQELGYIDYDRLLASLPTATDPEAYCGPP